MFKTGCHLSVFNGFTAMGKDAFAILLAHAPYTPEFWISTRQNYKKRKFKGDTYTVGDLFLDGKFFCNTIEDKVRLLPKS
jgi:hypothetical protein